LKNAFIFFIISPFLGVIQAFKNYREKWAVNSVWFFVVFFGYTMYRPESMDSYRYVLKLEKLYYSSLSWESFLLNLYNEEGNVVDIYQPLMSYFISMFTANGNVLFAMYGLVFGYFYSRNIWMVLNFAKETKMNMNRWILIFVFVSIVGYWDLNGVRMWTAAHIFFYGAFKYLMEGKHKGMLIAALTILVHFSFILPVGLLALFYVIKLPWTFTYFFYLVSFFISNLNLDQIGARLERILPSFLTPKINSYLNEDYVEVISRVKVQTSWFVIYYSKSIDWVLVILLSVIYFTRKLTSKHEKSFNNLFGFTLVFLAISNILAAAPSGGRYLMVAKLFAIALLFLFYIQYNNKFFNTWLYLLRPFLVFFLVISLRLSLDNTTVMTIFTNPLIVAFVDFPKPLLEFFK